MRFKWQNGKDALIVTPFNDERLLLTHFQHQLILTTYKVKMLQKTTSFGAKLRQGGFLETFSPSEARRFPLAKPQT